MLKRILSRLGSLFERTDPNDKRIKLRDGDALLASVQGERVIAYTFDIALSHREFVIRNLGTLPEGAWVGTIRKFGGVVIAVNSRTYYENQLPAPQPVLDVIHENFR
jgi:hypothetical protein